MSTFLGHIETRIESRDVRIVNGAADRDPRGTDIYDRETGDKLLDVYRAFVTVDGVVHEVSRSASLPFDYEGSATLERAAEVLR